MNIEQIWSDWKVDKLIGEGSFGKVYRIEREDFGHTYEAALKVIEIPQNQSEVQTVRNEGLSKEYVTEYFKSMVTDIVDEFVLMSELKGHTNIVNYEDHKVIEKESEFGWEIYIRMELLTPLFNYLESHTFTMKEVIKLGIDICTALERCQKYNIIHRDIKPENIFISKAKDFKLGDFGIARQLEKTSSGLSKKGTYTYMAPEVYKGEGYNSSVDIYSLGIVLYRFLNNNRTPFMPPAPQPIKYEDKEKANVLRISGHQLPKPCNANGILAEVVLKACAYDPKERYESPESMRHALEEVLKVSEEKELSEELRNRIEDIEISYVTKPSETDGTEYRFITQEEMEQRRKEKEERRRKEEEERRRKEEEENLKACTSNQEEGYENLESMGHALEEVLKFSGIKELCDSIEDNKTDAHTEREKDDADDALWVGITDEEREKKRKKAEESKCKLEQEKNRKKKEKLKTIRKEIAVILGAFFVIMIVIIGSILGTSSRKIVVPSLKNLKIEDARRVVEREGLVIEESYEPALNLEKGLVLSQKEKAGEETQKGNTIHVVVCSGTILQVPNVVGEKKALASQKLKEAGFEVKFKEAYSDKVAKGIVISQKPQKNSNLVQGETVQVTISKGTQLVKVPNVEGINSSKAEKKLETAGLIVSVEEEYSDSVEKGFVITQSVNAGKSVKKGSKIEIVVSKGEKYRPIQTPSQGNDSSDEWQVIN